MSTAADHLDALGRALTAAGWSSRACYRQVPARLRVFDPTMPRFGDSVAVGAGPDGALWFISSTGAPLAPVGDVSCAVVRVAALVAAYRPLAERLGLAAPVRAVHRPP